MEENIDWWEDVFQFLLLLVSSRIFILWYQLESWLAWHMGVDVFVFIIRKSGGSLSHSPGRKIDAPSDDSKCRRWRRRRRKRVVVFWSNWVQPRFSSPSCFPNCFCGNFPIHVSQHCHLLQRCIYFHAFHPCMHIHMHLLTLALRTHSITMCIGIYNYIYIGKFWDVDICHDFTKSEYQYRATYCLRNASSIILHDVNPIRIWKRLYIYTHVNYTNLWSCTQLSSPPSHRPCSEDVSLTPQPPSPSPRL